MRLVIDARLYGIEHRGLGRYVQELVNQLIKQDQINSYYLLINPANQEQPDNLPTNFHLVAAPYRVYTLAEQLYLPRLIRQLKPDLIHYPHFNAPWLSPRPYIVTIHDLIIHHFPDRQASVLPSFLYWLKLKVYFGVIGRAVKRARKIITVSQTVARDIINFYPAAADKIQVVYLAPFLRSDDSLSSKMVGKGDNYLLAVGAAYPHKNLDRLLRAFKIVVATDKSLRLVIVGRLDYFMKKIKNLSAQLSLTGQVIFTGQVTDNQLVDLYKNSRAYILPSLMEGFGLGPLEALRFNRPVLLSDLPVLREIIGAAGEYFNPLDINDMARVIKQALTTPDLSLVNPLPRLYDWSKTALITREIYQMTTKK